MQKALPWIALVLSILAISLTLASFMDANISTQIRNIDTRPLPDYPCTGGSC